MKRLSSILERFDSDYEGLPAARVETSKAYEDICAQLVEGGYSFKTKVVPPKAKRYPRQIIVILVGPAWQ